MNENQGFIKNDALKNECISELLSVIEGTKPHVARFQKSGVPLAAVATVPNPALEAELRLIDAWEMQQLDYIVALIKEVGVLAKRINEDVACLRRGLPKVYLTEFSMLGEAIRQLTFESGKEVTKLGLGDRQPLPIVIGGSQ